MMAIHEEPHPSESAVAAAATAAARTSLSSSLPPDSNVRQVPEGIPMEFQDLYRDEELTQTLIDLIHTAADLDILDFQEFCKHIDTPKPMWSKTQATTGKHIPVY